MNNSFNGMAAVAASTTAIIKSLQQVEQSMHG